MGNSCQWCTDNSEYQIGQMFIETPLVLPEGQQLIRNQLRDECMRELKIKENQKMIEIIDKIVHYIESNNQLIQYKAIQLSSEQEQPNILQILKIDIFNQSNLSQLFQEEFTVKKSQNIETDINQIKASFSILDNNNKGQIIVTIHQEQLKQVSIVAISKLTYFDILVLIKKDIREIFFFIKSTPIELDQSQQLNIKKEEQIIDTLLGQINNYQLSEIQKQKPTKEYLFENISPIESQILISHQKLSFISNSINKRDIVKMQSKYVKIKTSIKSSGEIARIRYVKINYKKIIDQFLLDQLEKEQINETISSYYLNAIKNNIISEIVQQYDNKNYSLSTALPEDNQKPISTNLNELKTILK